MNIEKLKVLINDYLRRQDFLQEKVCLDPKQMATVVLNDFSFWVAQQQPHDIFIERAAQILGIKPEDVTPEQRKQIRALTFHIDFAGGFRG